MRYAHDEVNDPVYDGIYPLGACCCNNAYKNGNYGTDDGGGKTDRNANGQALALSRAPALR